jgi:geranylgeranyl diphosphate synthase type II
MRYTLFNAGKRLRPGLVLETCRALGGETRQALPAACAIEYIHTYSLIHDDLPAMDDDDLRRGKPSSHKVYGEATAILAGDALQAAAFEAIARTPDPALVPALSLSLARAAGAAGMVGGQELDLSPRAPIDEIHRRKTAALFSSAAEMGALAARSPRAAALALYGRHLGLAFQIVDDILDHTERGRRNYAAAHGMKRARAAAARHAARARGALAFMGKRGEPLSLLAEYVLARDH